MNINNSQFLSNLQLQEALLSKNKDSVRTNVSVQSDTRSFKDILNNKLEDNRVSDMKFSKHAINRLESRNISLTDLQMNRLSDGTRRAGEKGIKESLVLVDELAFIVNTENNTVVTAMNQTNNDENIFTNIDGAVIA